MNTARADPSTTYTTSARAQLDTWTNPQAALSYSRSLSYAALEYVNDLGPDGAVDNSESTMFAIA